MKKEKVYLWYLLATFIVSYLFQFVIYKTGGVQSPIFTLVMWIPGIIAIIFILIRKKGLKKIGWRLKKWQYIIPAILIPLAAAIFVVLFLEVFRLGDYSGNIFTFRDGMVEITNISLILGNQTQSIYFFILNFTVSHILFLFAGSLITLGEEIGWRGFLQEKMLIKFGLNKGFILLGIIWGYWHMPVVLMGFNFPNHPVLGALFFMPLGTVFIGIFLGWLYLKTQSIWIPALAHASANLFSQLIFSFITMHQDELFRQLSWIVIWAIIAIPCLINLNKKNL